MCLSIIQDALEEKIVALRTHTVTYHLRPTIPFAAKYPLTLADVATTPPVNSRYLLCYESPNDDWDRQNLIERLLISLQSFLREPQEGILAIPEILGKIHSDPNTSEHFIRVTEASNVRCIVAYRDDINYKDLGPEKGFPMNLLKGNVFATGLQEMPVPDCNGDIEGFSVQVTFVNGGFVICISKHHFVLDGNAIAKLVAWWFKKARSYKTEKVLLDADIVPKSRMMLLHDRSSLLQHQHVEPQDHFEWKVVPGSPPSVFGLVPPSKIFLAFVKCLPRCMIPKIDNAIFHFTPAALRQLHADVSKHADIKLSRNDVVCALLWRCVTRARLYARDEDSWPATSSLAMAVNGRRKLSPPLADEYMGNCVFFAPSSVPVPILTSMGSMSLSEVAVTIRESLLEKTSNTWQRSILQLAASQPKLTDMVMAFNIFMGTDLMITSWERYFDSLEDLDVGFGRFQRLRLPDGTSFDGMAMVLPAYGMRDKDTVAGAEFPGGLEISLDLSRGPMECLKRDGEWTRYARFLAA